MTIDSTTGVVSWPSPILIDSPHTITIRATNAAGYDEESWKLVNTETTSSELPRQRQLIENSSKSIEVHLAPKTSNGKYRLNWSPSGKRHELIQTVNGLETKIYLGPKELPPILARLEKSNGSKNYDILKVDGNRNGGFEESEILATNPSVRREKIWSSFKTIIDIPATDPWTGNSISNPYSMSLWYVEDPREENQEKLLRFTREWWLEGAAKLDGIDCLILVSEMKMDGMIDENDEWALAYANEPQKLYQLENTQSITQHAWLGNNAYRIKEIHPSGRKLTIEPFVPNITKEEDLKRRDPYSEDREVPRSGKTVTFLHNFKEAEALARKENKPLFIDFETTWCGPCKTMDQLVYTADAVVKAAQNVISVKVDGDEQPELKEQFRVNSYPTIILLTPQGRELKRISGYDGVKEVAEFLDFKSSEK
jgi:thiol-disulfide isomerase/thioredoxin